MEDFKTFMIYWFIGTLMFGVICALIVLIVLKWLLEADWEETLHVMGPMCALSSLLAAWMAADITVNGVK